MESFTHVAFRGRPSFFALRLLRGTLDEMRLYPFLFRCTFR